MKSYSLLDWAKIFFYIALIAMFAIFTTNYGIVDLDKIVEQTSDVVQETADLVKCEIEYKEFRYSGLCVNEDILFPFVLEMTNYEREKKDDCHKEPVLLTKCVFTSNGWQSFKSFTGSEYTYEQMMSDKAEGTELTSCIFTDNGWESVEEIMFNKQKSGE